MPLSKLHQLAIAIFVAASIIVIAWVSGLVVGSFFFENCVLAAAAWDSFAALGIGFSFIWVTVVLFKMINKKFEKLFGSPARKEGEPITKFYMDIAASIQKVLEYTVLKICRSIKKETKNSF